MTGCFQGAWKFYHPNIFIREAVEKVYSVTRGKIFYQLLLADHMNSHYACSCISGSPAHLYITVNFKIIPILDKVSVTFTKIRLADTFLL